MSICNSCIHYKVCSRREKCQEMENGIKLDEKDGESLSISVTCKDRETRNYNLPSQPLQPSPFKTPYKTPCERTITWYKTTDSTDTINKMLDKFIRE